MIDNFLHTLFSGFTYVRKHPQILFTVLLIVFIPIAFLLSGQQFLVAAKDNQERLEKERVGMLHDVFASFLVVANFDREIIQREIDKIASQNTDITKFQLVKGSSNGVEILASLYPEEVGTVLPDTSLYTRANVSPGGTLIIPYIEHGTRYWESVRSLQTETGAHYYIYTETSLAYIDTIFSNRIDTAYMWLIGILVIILFLVVRHVRLIDYAYLYSETKKANEMKDLFTNMVAHELRAPLTAMRGYASIIRESHEVSESVKADAGRIEESAGRLVLIVNDLLDVARMHSGKLSIQSAPCNVQKVIQVVIDTLKSSAEEKSIILTQDGVRNELSIAVDEKRLIQALTNLVSNSIKYTHAGSITLGLEDRGDRIEIRVKDTGMGISAENQKKLFAPFYRVVSDEVNQTVGTGLGMWITKQLIELMKGSIGVESIKGVGTHIVVTLPK